MKGFARACGYFLGLQILRRVFRHYKKKDYASKIFSYEHQF